MPSAEHRLLFRNDRHEDGRPLTKEEREELVKPYLPEPRGPKTDPSTLKKQRVHDPILHAFSKAPSAQHAPRLHGWQRPRIRPFLAHVVHTLLFQLIQLIFSIYMHTRRVYHAILFQCQHLLYYHHRSPELIQKDVKGLSRLPQHLSVVLDMQTDDGGLGDGANWEGLEKLARDVCEIAAWCACAGIPLLSVYERTGILKRHAPYLSGALKAHLKTYFATGAEPSFDVRAPHQAPPYEPRAPRAAAAAHLDVLLISESDGRDTLVDLTKTLAEMAQRGKLSPSDISTDLIDGQVTEASFPEPDLLVVMAPSPYRRPRAGARRQKRRASRAGDDVGAGTSGYAGGELCLRGYPPWQARLTEIFHVKDSHGVAYQFFLRALYRFAQAEMRFGR